MTAIRYNETVVAEQETIQASGNWFGSITGPRYQPTRADRQRNRRAADSKVDFLRGSTPAPTSAAIRLTVSKEASPPACRRHEPTRTVAYGPLALCRPVISRKASHSSVRGTVKILCGIYAETVDATTNSVALAPGASPAQVTVSGDMMLDGDDTLDIEIDGLSPPARWSSTISSSRAPRRLADRY